MSDTSIKPVESGYAETLSRIVAAGGTTLGVGAFASLFSLSLNEQLYRFIDADLSIVQLYVLGLMQAAFVFFIIRKDIPSLFNEGWKLPWLLASVVVGFLLTFWLSSNAEQARSDMSFLFGSPFWHAAVWIFYAVAISALVDAFMFHGYLFHALQGLPTWLIACAALFFYCMAGGYTLGFDGISQNLKLGVVLVALRVAGGSFTYTAVAAAIYRGVDQFALLWPELS